jgi:WhiB family redox-sensing transcriptional regulator
MNTEWMNRAKCKDRIDLNWFPENGQNARQTIKFCVGCPVRTECFDYAIRHKFDDGIWGGVSANQRNLYRRRIAKRV